MTHRVVLIAGLLLGTALAARADETIPLGFTSGGSSVECSCGPLTEWSGDMSHDVATAELAGVVSLSSPAEGRLPGWGTVTGFAHLIAKHQVDPPLQWGQSVRVRAQVMEASTSDDQFTYASLDAELNGVDVDDEAFMWDEPPAVGTIVEATVTNSLAGDPLTEIELKVTLRLETEFRSDTAGLLESDVGQGTVQAIARLQITNVTILR